MKEEMFITGLSILILFNVIYYIAAPAGTLTNLILGAATSIGLAIAGVITAVVAGGLQIEIFGSSVSLSTYSQKLMIMGAILLPLLFQTQIAGINFGLGLCTNVFTAFSNGDFWYFGLGLSSMLALVTLISGFLLVTE